MSPGFLVTVRCVLAAVMSLYALTQASVGLMVLGFKTGNPGMVAASEGAVAGDSAAPYAALMEQMPMTLVWAALLAVLLYLAGSVALAFGWRRAPLLLLVAFALELAGKVATRFLPAWSQTFGARDAAIDLVTLGALAGLGILAFWLAAQRPHTPV